MVAKGRYDGALRDVRTLLQVGAIGGLTDGQLLERFLTRRGEAGDLAFAVLVERHGPMVMHTCRSMLRDPNDADDAFQATFLVLARKAGSLRVRESLGGWLHEVARRLATRARSDSSRRRRHERRASLPATSAVGAREPCDVGPVLHDELGRLPENFRLPLILCYLEGLTHEQAAQRLDWPVGTVRSRLARGRDRLRDRLARRGAAPSLALLAGRVCPDVIPVAPALVDSTTRAAVGFVAPGTTPAVVMLAGGLLRELLWAKVARVAGLVLTAGLIATAVGGLIAPSNQGARGTPWAVRARGGSARTSPAYGRPKTEAERVAERVLKAGSDLFDAKRAEALAATYTEDGTIHLVDVREGSYRDDVTRGRAEVERFYRNGFQGAGAIDSKNTLEFARFVAPDVLVIHGRFRPNAREEELPFVQVRLDRDGRWQLQALWLFLASKPR